jgi:hypothetical protein
MNTNKGEKVMQENRIRELRQKQLIYTNILYVCFLLFLFVFIFFKVTATAVYLLLGIFCLVSLLGSLLTKAPNPLILLFPGMKEVNRYEKEKLGERWSAYHLSSVLLLLVGGIFFFVQAWVRDGNAPFVDGMPGWYLAGAPIAFLLIANWHLLSHIKRIDKWSAEKLRAYAGEKMLFSVVFVSVVLGMTVLGTLIYLLMAG